MAPQLPSPPKRSFLQKKSIPGIPRARSLGADKSKKACLASSLSFNLDSHNAGGHENHASSPHHQSSSQKKQPLKSSQSFNLDRPLSNRKLLDNMSDSGNISVSTLPEKALSGETSTVVNKGKPRLMAYVVLFLCLAVLVLMMQRQDRVHSGFHLHHKSKLRQAMKVQVVGENTPLMDGEGQVMQVQVVAADQETGTLWVSPASAVAKDGKEVAQAGTASEVQVPLPTSQQVAPAHNSLPKLEDNERSIALIHVGKNGGSTLRSSTAIICKSQKEDWMTDTQHRIKDQRCIDRLFSNDQKLARQTKQVFHMWAMDPERIAASTSFLVPIRNPVSRIISTYRYSHPGNCNDKSRPQAPFGCHIEDEMKRPRTEIYMLFGTCFPSPAMEDFAQSVKSPFSPSHFLNDQTWPKPKISTQMMQRCRKLARDIVNGSHSSAAAPHMYYNYNYYLQETLWKYPEKEVFAIRTEYELDDMVALDQQLGGSGRKYQALQRQEKSGVSHGSEHYQPSPLSEEAYHKLCCVLENEIDLYLQVMDRAVNLDASAKQASVDDLTQKCGVKTSWTEWRATCQAELQQDHTE